MADDWITVQQAAELTGYHVEYLRELIREGRVRARKFADVWAVSRKSLLDYIREQAQRGEKRGRKPAH